MKRLLPGTLAEDHEGRKLMKLEVILHVDEIDEKCDAVVAELTTCMQDGEVVKVTTSVDTFNAVIMDMREIPPAGRSS